MEEHEVALPVSSYSSSTPVNEVHHASAPSSSSSSSSSSSEPLQQEVNRNDQDQMPELQQQRTSVSYRVNISISQVTSTYMRDDACSFSFLMVLLTFWFFSSMTVIMGFYGSMNLQLGPNYSRLVQVNSIFVQDIKVRDVVGENSGPILYGFYKVPPLDVKAPWSENHNISIPPSDHKEWIYYLNEGSEINISYSVKSQSSSPLSLVIAKGKESLVKWIADPSYPNTTLSWNIIHGNGVIQQKIFKSSDYYVAVRNLNSEVVKVQLNLRLQAVLYNTTEAYYKCSISRSPCSLTLLLLGTNVAVLTSPDPILATDENLYTKMSYGPRWMTYFVGSAGMTILILLAYKFCNKFQSTSEDGTQFQPRDVGSERTPLLSQKDEVSSLGSSYDSVSNDEEDLEECLVASTLDSKPQKDGENSNRPHQLCGICFDSPRDCFFLPCGHCAACFTCGTRILEEAGMCPICRRKMKKVRKIITI